MNPLVAENARLRQRIEELEELLRFEREEKAPAPKRVCDTFGMSPGEFAIAECIAAASPNVARHERLIQLLKKDRHVDAMHCMQVKICLLRKKLKRFNIAVRSDWGSGYVMPKEDAERFFEIVRKAQFGEDPVEVEHGAA